jgi:hypothetical protein
MNRQQDSEAPPAYWFPAKRYGWGWGVPTRWEGWSVLISFVALVALGAFLFPPRTSLPSFLTYVAILSVVLIGICWLKGEPPRWRCGSDGGG